MIIDPPLVRVNIFLNPFVFLPLSSFGQFPSFPSTDDVIYEQSTINIFEIVVNNQLQWIAHLPECMRNEVINETNVAVGRTSLGFLKLSKGIRGNISLSPDKKRIKAKTWSPLGNHLECDHSKSSDACRRLSQDFHYTMPRLETADLLPWSQTYNDWSIYAWCQF